MEMVSDVPGKGLIELFVNSLRHLVRAGLAENLHVQVEDTRAGLTEKNYVPAPGQSSPVFPLFP